MWHMRASKVHDFLNRSAPIQTRSVCSAFADWWVAAKHSDNSEPFLATTVNFIDVILLWLHEDSLNYDFGGPTLSGLLCDETIYCLTTNPSLNKKYIYIFTTHRFSETSVDVIWRHTNKNKLDVIEYRCWVTKSWPHQDGESGRYNKCMFFYPKEGHIHMKCI